MNLRDISEKIKSFKKDNQTALIAIEGFGGSGKSTLAEELKRLLPDSEIIKIDSFIIKEEAQNAEPWEEVFDRKRLEEQVLKPVTSDLPVSYQRFEWAENKLGETITLPKLDYLIIDGISSYHPDIEHYYNFKIWVDTPIDVAKERGQHRDKDNENAELWDKWAQCDLSYQQKYHPEQRADLVVNNSSNTEVS